MASVRGVDSTPLLRNQVKSASTDDAAFLDDVKAEAESETRIPELLQIMLNMSPAFFNVFTDALNNYKEYKRVDFCMFLATTEPYSLFRWKQDAVKFRIAWMCQADDLPSFLNLVIANVSLRYALFCVLKNATHYFEVDPDTKLTESKRNEWRKIIRSFEVRFEATPVASATTK